MFAYSPVEIKEGDVEQIVAVEGDEGESSQVQEKTLTLAEWKALQVRSNKMLILIFSLRNYYNYVMFRYHVRSQYST